MNMLITARDHAVRYKDMDPSKLIVGECNESILFSCTDSGQPSHGWARANTTASV